MTVRRVTGGVLAVLAIVLVWRLGGAARLAEVLEHVRGLGPWGPPVLIALYVVACVAMVPGSVLTLGAGALFGVVRGTICVSIGATLGATAAFLVSRHLARPWVSRRFGGRPGFREIDEAVARDGWRIVALTRLSPVFPFNFLNYAFGLTRVRLVEYVVASWLAMLPGTVMYVWLGAAAGSLAAARAAERPKSAGEWALQGIGLAATAAATWWIARHARAALRRRLDGA